MPKKQPGPGGRPTVQQLLNEEAEGSLEGFVFDPAVCKRAFEHYDKDGSGFLDGKELMKLADKLWDTFIPDGPKLSENEKKVLVSEIKSKTDIDGDENIDYQEFLPWFKSMNEKFYRISHPKTAEQKAAEKNAAEPQQSIAKSPTPASVKDETSAAERERSTPKRERAAPQPEEQTFKSYSPASTRVTTSNPRGSEATLDLETLKAKIAELRNSVQGFASALDSRLDMCLQSVKAQSTDLGGEGIGSGGVV